MSLWLSRFRFSTSIRQSRSVGRPRLCVEMLEAREVPASYLVTTADDTSGLTPTGGTGTASNPFLVATLRSAIELANASTGRADTIRFDPEMANSIIYLNSINAPLTFERGAKTTVDGTGREITVNGLGFERFKRVFNVESGAKAEIKSLTIENGIDGFDSLSGGMGADPITDFGGGGVYNAGRLTLANVLVTGNQSIAGTGGGGGILNAVGAILTLNDSTVTGNQASGSFRGAIDGGGILNEGKMTITRSTVSDNSASGSGGGIANFGNLTVTASTLSENRTEQFNENREFRVEASVAGGGGIFNNGTLSMTNATISGNSTQFAGGGVSNGGSGSATLRNCTITENSAGTGGGIFVGLLNSGEYFRLRNTIVSANFNSSESLDDIFAFQIEGSTKAPISATFCLIGTFTPNSFTGSGNLVNVNDPMLGGLDDNGGPTSTHLPLPGSPVINMGNPSSAGLPGRDQRGFNFYRVRGGRVDIGAVEVQEGSFPGGGLTPPPGSGDDRRYH